MRTLALDPGRKRIGVAISDPTGTIAQPLETIQVRTKREVIDRLQQLVRELSVDEILVGLPRTAEGELGPQAKRVLGWARHFDRYLGVPVIFRDESFSSQEAERILIERATPRRRREARLDAVAAAVVLQDYLDARSMKP